ncbi:hypothetical protein CVT24_001777 [Panaeolus cyanescens]|uniref:Uncharacterized protein n=1 Tax=Panaeolus cyanescens TaxID=181874 RepID=A0A409YUA5_9AGAR|nr:hypothetical protein CVT24_001777 [Panaeolus cyanescens]
MPPTTTLIPNPTKTVVIQSPLPITTVLSRLDSILHKQASLDIMRKLSTVQTQQELESAVGGVTQGQDFLFFTQFPHHRLLSIHDNNGTSSPSPSKPKPQLFLYTIGNPLLAQRIIRLNPLAAGHIPPRILVAEIQPEDDINGDNKSGTLHPPTPIHPPSTTTDNSNTPLAAIPLNKGTVISYTLPSSVMLQSPFALGVGLRPDHMDWTALRSEVMALDDKLEKLVGRVMSVEEGDWEVKENANAKELTARI